MLKRLELIGFKSFADRTWFDFPAGLSAVVGPNGSGKSNVVDAVRWVLGEQSARTLRGGEMADVIFNGSTRRKGLGMAEVTMVLDNSRKMLNSEANEFSVTRRVYRDGSGEYLINGKIVRLKDVRDLFLGTGAGTAASCIIEQGRVDALLQASPKDRRAILEEAAGISRFRARKIETLRKLDQTEENLNRLRDVQAEVESRLRRVRLDAEKAKKYQEYTSRLKDLRLNLGLREYHVLSARLNIELQILERLRTHMQESEARVAQAEIQNRKLEQIVAQAEAESHRAVQLRSESVRLIATLRERFQNELSKLETIDREAETFRRRSLELFHLSVGLSQAAAQQRERLAHAERELEQRRNHSLELDAQMDTHIQELTKLRDEIDQGREEQFRLVGESAALESRASSDAAQLEKFTKERDRKRRESEAKAIERASADRVLQALAHRDEDLQNRLSIARQNLAQQVAIRDQLERDSRTMADALEDLRVRRGGLLGRLEVLENLERNQEGLSAGVREVLSEINNGGVLGRAVYGMVGDLLRVPREVAPLIDAALGEQASYLVARDAGALDSALATRRKPLAGRVTFLPLNRDYSSAVLSSAPSRDLRTADRWVTCEHPDLGGLPKQLLGQTYIVDDLNTARRLSRDSQMAGCRFVTRDGEVLHPDGTLTAGPYSAAAGLLSRKSELRELRAQDAELAHEIGLCEQRIVEIRETINLQNTVIVGLEGEVKALTSDVSDLKNEILRQEQQVLRLEDELNLNRSETRLLEEEIGKLEQTYKEIRRRADEAKKAEQQLRARLSEQEARARVLEEARAALSASLTAARVELAESAQNVNNIRNELQKLEQDLSRGRIEAQRNQRHELALQTRRFEAEMNALKANAGLADAFHAKEHAERVYLEQEQIREQAKNERRMIQEELANTRDESRQQIEHLHTRELAVSELQANRKQIVDRLLEEYSIDLAEEYRKSNLNSGDPDTFDCIGSAKEAEELRKKIRQLGAVNLESLQELEEVESRAKDLGQQVNDLTQARWSLREIIDRINSDSRRLFDETYQSVRRHFQELFRKLFGGGMADVILEDPNDLLESGIEVVARPPGKELRSLTLMSGGEKTMTAISLLLAIFQAKPAPFCLLDEVDAALDEANTERLGRALREFTDRSQFIIITHKKRTMALADVLFGVTMQEGGVSKQIAVKLEDWPDEQTSTTKAA
ncbi:MAG: chromosome segregation protein SMC [Gemmataceae bacterium]|jgi:chromosome segregation protein|nr:chromosome segregation protein SMC [Gemmataceae bacterium]